MDRLKTILIAFILFPLLTLNAHALSTLDTATKELSATDTGIEAPNLTPADNIKSPATVTSEPKVDMPLETPKSNESSISPSIDIDDAKSPELKEIPKTNDSLHRNTNRITNDELKTIEREEHPVFDSSKDTEGTKTRSGINEGVQPINQGYETNSSKQDTNSNLNRQNP